MQQENEVWNHLGVRVVQAEVWPVLRPWGASQGPRMGRETGHGVRVIMGQIRQGLVAIVRALAFTQSELGGMGGY